MCCCFAKSSLCELLLYGGLPSVLCLACLDEPRRLNSRQALTLRAAGLFAKQLHVPLQHLFIHIHANFSHTLTHTSLC